MTTGDVESKLGQSLDDLIKSQKKVRDDRGVSGRRRYVAPPEHALPLPLVVPPPPPISPPSPPSPHALPRPHRQAAPKKKKTPSKGVKPPPKSKPKAGKKAATTTPKAKKGVAIKVKKVKTPVSVKGGVKKGKGKATPMAIDSTPSASRRAQRTAVGGKTKVLYTLVGGKGKGKSGGGTSGGGGGGSGRAQNGQRKFAVKGETGHSINGRFEKIAHERSKGPRIAGKGTTNKFGVYMPF